MPANVRWDLIRRLKGQWIMTMMSGNILATFEVYGPVHRKYIQIYI
jgi:hypothetical protein